MEDDALEDEVGCLGGIEVQRRCRVVQQRCRDKRCSDPGAEAEVMRCRGAEVQRGCRGGAQGVQRCRGTE